MKLIAFEWVIKRLLCLYFILLAMMVTAYASADDVFYILGGVFDLGILSTSSLPHPELLGGEDWGNSFRSKVYTKVDDVTFSAVANEGFRFGTEESTKAHAYPREMSVSAASDTAGTVKAGRLENPIYIALGNGTLDPFMWGRNNAPLLNDAGARLTGASWLSPSFFGGWSIALEHGEQIKTELAQNLGVINYNSKKLTGLVAESITGDSHETTAGGRVSFDWGAVVGVFQHTDTSSAFSAGLVKSFDNNKGEFESSFTWLNNDQKQTIIGATHTLDEAGRWTAYTSISRTQLPNAEAINSLIIGIRWLCLSCLLQHF